MGADGVGLASGAAEASFDQIAARCATAAAVGAVAFTFIFAAIVVGTPI